MIEVIKIGENAIKHITCFSCKSKLKFTMKDCKVVNSFDEIPFVVCATDYSLNCPICGHYIPVKSDAQFVNGEFFDYDWCEK